jgi:hypothetical protein
MLPRAGAARNWSTSGGLDRARVSATIAAQRESRMARHALDPAGDARMALKLILGSKNYSSWSFRPWLAMTVAGIAFEETVLPIYTSGARKNPRIFAVRKSAGADRR